MTSKPPTFLRIVHSGEPVTTTPRKSDAMLSVAARKTSASDLAAIEDVNLHASQVRLRIARGEFGLAGMELSAAVSALGRMHDKTKGIELASMLTSLRSYMVKTEEDLRCWKPKS